MWSGLLVQGQDVTKHQAQEILVRTQDFNFSTNLLEHHKQLLQIAQIQCEKRYNHPKIYPNSLKETQKTYQTLNLKFLQNHQIVSNHIAGPHGWCNWNGKIVTNNYNVGPHPYPEKILEEWQIIAQTFPFLKLTCQLLDNEIDADIPTRPIAQFNIQNGNATTSMPTLILLPAQTPAFEKFLHQSNQTEIGCSTQDFQLALATTKLILNASQNNIPNP